MPILKRFNEIQGLADVDVLFEEEGLNSNFFNITEFPDPLQVGKNSFLIAGSAKLLDFTELKIDIIDSEGNSIYHEPVRDYLEGNMRRISVEVYDTNAPGSGYLYIVGEAHPERNEVPPIWQGVYNVRYVRPISINTTQQNTQPIFFYKQPRIRGREITKAFIEELPASASYSLSGSVTVTATDPGSEVSFEGINDDEEHNPAVVTAGADQVGKFLRTYKNKRENKRSVGAQPTVLALGSIQRRASPETPSHTITINNLESSPENDDSKATSAFVGGKIIIRSAQVDESTFPIGGNQFIKTQSIYSSRIQEVINSTTLIPESPFTLEVHPSKQTGEKEGYEDPDFDSNRVWANVTPGGRILDEFLPSNANPKQPDTSHTDETGAVWVWSTVTDTSRIPKEEDAGGDATIDYYGWSASGSLSQDQLDNAVTKYNVSMISNSNVTMSILPTPGKTLSGIYLRSYADFSVVNMRTFSGDIFRMKVYGKIRGALTDFELLYDSPTEAPQVLIDPFSVDGFTNVGYFYSQSIVDNYWASSSNSIVTQNDDYIVDGVLISGSNAGLGETCEFFTTSSYDLERNVRYSLAFDSYYLKQDKVVTTGGGDLVTQKRAELKVYLSGSKSKDGTGDLNEDIYLGSVKVPQGPETIEGEQKGVFQTFTSAAKHFPEARPKFVATSGQWVVKDVELKPSEETNFSPDYFRTIIPLPYLHKRPALMDFLVEFYDLNNNIADSFAFLENFRIIGAPEVIQGDNNVLSGSMYLGNLQGEGIELHGGSAYMRSIGYEGFQSTISSGSGGFMIWSGSLDDGVRSDGSSLLHTTESYEGVGLEIVDAHGATDRYLQFRTNPSTFKVQTDEFFLGSSLQFVSGSNSKIEISSSNFHLQPDGDVVMSGTVTATAGNIGNWTVSSGNIVGTNITMDANNSTIYKTDQGPGSDSGAAFDQLRDEYYLDFTPETENPDNYFIKMGPSFMVDKDGILIASGAVFEGTITASAGLIGGFHIGSASLFAGSSEDVPKFFISGSATGNAGGVGGKSSMFISASKFQVTAEGDITGSQVLFTGGTIGGFELASTQINSTNDNLILKSSGQITGSTVLFTGGKIAGWVVDDNTVYNLTSAKYSGLSSTGTVRIFAGADNLVAGTGSAVFNVKSDGVVTASAGLIGGWQINPSPIEIRSPNERLVLSAVASAERITVKDADDDAVIKIGEISSDTSDKYGIKIFDGTGKADDNVGTGTVVMLGGLGNKIGGWQITDTQIRSIPSGGFGAQYDFDAGEDGLILQTNPTESRIETAGFVSGLKGFRMSSIGNGSAEFENMRIRGTLRTTVFEKESVNVVGGQLMVANSTTIQALKSGSVILAGTSSVSATEVTMSVANASGFSRGEILKVKAVDDIGFSVEYLQVTGSKRYSEDPTLAYLTASLHPSGSVTSSVDEPPIDPDGLAGELYVGRGYGSIGPSLITTSISYTSGSIGLASVGDVPTLGATDTIFITDTGSLSTQDIIKIDEEKMKITNISGSGTKASASLTVIRDFHDTIQAVHKHTSEVIKLNTDMQFLAGLVSTARPYQEGQVLVSTGKYAQGTDWNGRFDYQENLSTVNISGSYKLTSGSTHLTEEDKKDADTLVIHESGSDGTGHDALYSLFDKGSYIVLLVESPYSSTSEWYRYRVNGNPSYTGAVGSKIHTFPITLNQTFFDLGDNKDTEDEAVEFWFLSNIQDVTSGYIMMNANPNDPYSPYMDFIERTGSGVYDLQLRTRLGDLSGLSSAYLYGDEEPGFGLYTENGFFKGTIHAMTGSIHGILNVATTRGGIETNQKITIGRGVDGTHDGFRINNNNYWFTTGEFRLGDGNNYLWISGSEASPSDTFKIKTGDLSINTTKFIVSSSLNNGTIKMGGVSSTWASGVTSTTNTGIYMDGTGVFRVGESVSSGDNFIYYDGSTIQMKSTNYDLNASTIRLQSVNGGNFALGSSIPSNLSSTGIFLSGSGEFNLQKDGSNYIRQAGSTFQIKSSDLDINASGVLRISGSSAGAAIRMGSSGGPTGSADDTNSGVFMDHTGKWAFVQSSNAYIRYDSALEIKTPTLELDTANIEISSTHASMSLGSSNQVVLKGSSGGTIAMGSPAPAGSGFDGIFLSGSGEFNFQSSSKGYLRYDSEGFALNFPSFSVDTFGRMNATAGTFKGHLEAKTGFFGSSSNDGWNISANTIADSDNIIQLDATAGSENITITSGSFVAEFVPNFSDASTILSAGGLTYSGNPSAATFTAATGVFEAGSSGNLDRDVEDITTGAILSSALALYGGFSDETTPVVSTGLVGTSNEATLSGGTKVYRSSVSIVVGIAVQVAQYNLNSELNGFATVTGELILYDEDDDPVATQALTAIILIDQPDSGGTATQRFTKPFSTTFTHTVVTNTTNYYIKASGIKVRNNGIMESWVDNDKSYTATTYITETALYFTSMAHQPSNKKVEIAPKGIQAVFLSSATLEHPDNKYFRVAPEEDKTVDILGSMYVTGSLALKSKSSDSETLLGAGTVHTSTYISSSGYIKGGNGSEVAPSIQLGSSDDGFYHLTSGDAGINVIVDNTQAFLFADNEAFHAGDNITAFSTTVASDERLKENIKPLENNLDKILKLKPSTFKWKVRDNQDDVGLIAQEVKPIIPIIVKEVISIGKTKKFLDGDPHKVIDYAKLSVYLVGAIKEQQTQIDELKQKLEEL